jgi:hypothetical protein
VWATTVRTSLDGGRDGVLGRGRVPLRVTHDGDGVAVGGDVPVEAPVPPDRARQQPGVGARRHAVDLRVRAHDAGGAGVDHAAPERRVERVLQVLRRDAGVEAVPRRAIPVLQVVRRGVLAAGRRLQRRARGVAALHAAHEGHGVPARDGRVLAGGLLTAAPPRVPEDVHVRGPHGEPLRLPDVEQRPGFTPDRLHASLRQKKTMLDLCPFFLFF